MANRLTQITTGAGDSGMTRLADGQRVAKSSLRIDALGAVDELNAAIGLCVATLKVLPNAESEFAEILSFCAQVQNELFNVGGELASPSNHFLSEAAVTGVEQFVEQANAVLPPLKEFVIPGQNVISAHAHLARCIARRAERELVRLNEEEPISPELLIYFNRLSDAFFIIARVTGRIESKEEPQWDRSR
jgi:cob(I)alamin adenosyltransferase